MFLQMSASPTSLVVGLQEYPVGITGEGVMGQKIRAGDCGAPVWLCVFHLSWDCIRRGREMRFQGGIQTSQGKTPALALLTNPSYVIFIHPLTPFLECVYRNLCRRKSE